MTFLAKEENERLVAICNVSPDVAAALYNTSSSPINDKTFDC